MDLKITLDTYLWNNQPHRSLFTESSTLDAGILSAIGARVCYSSDPIWKIPKDTRVTSLIEREDYLSRLQKARHYSVFAHSPIYWKGTRDADLEATIPYKAWKITCNNDLYVCLNLRHVLEHTSKEVIRVTGSQPEEIKTYSYREGWQEGIEEGCSIIVFMLPAPWYWMSVLVSDVSRCMSHQFVRHTWLNFCQRSHRYTKVDTVIIPESLREKAGDLARSFIKQSCKVYNELIEKGVPKEDARYLFPHGASTTIMASGPLFVWQDFIKKRLVKGAQHEIHEFARRLNNLIDKVL